MSPDTQSFWQWLRTPTRIWRPGGWKDGLAVFAMILIASSVISVLTARCAKAGTLPIASGQPVPDETLHNIDVVVASGGCPNSCLMTPAEAEWLGDMCATFGLVPGPFTPGMRIVIGATARYLCKAWAIRHVDNCVRNGCVPNNPITMDPPAAPNGPVWVFEREADDGE